MDETGAVPGSGHPNGRGADSPPVVELGRLRLLERAINTSHDGVLITDARLPDNPVIFANPAFEVLTGYAMAEVVGRNCRFLQCAETDPEQIGAVRAAISEGRDCRVELLNAKRDGSRFWNELSISPVFDMDGRVTHFIGILADVTQRRQALAESQIWQRVFEFAGVGLAHADPEAETFIAVNHAFAQQHGYQIAELTGVPVASVFAPDSLPTLRAQVEIASRLGHVAFEADHVRKDGTRFPVAIDVTVVKDDAGRPVSRIAFVRDVTERKRAEAGKQASDERLRLALRCARAGVWELDVATWRVFWSEEYRAVYGYGLEEPASAEAWRSRVHPDDAARVEDAVRRAIESDVTEWEQEFRIFHPETGQRWVIDHVYVVRTAGRARRLIGINIDITQRKSAEMQVESARHFAEEVLENANQGMVVYDSDMRVVACNRFIENYFGITREGALGKSIFELFPGMHAYQEDMHFELALRGETVSAKLPRLHLRGGSAVLPPEESERHLADPRAVWLLPTYAPHRDADDNIAGVIVSVVDVTALKRAQFDLAKTNDQLHRLTAHLEQVREEERSRIAREIHDELGGTITSIRMHLQAARADAAESRTQLPPQLEAVDSLLAAANQSVRRIISDLRPSILDHLGVWAAIEWYAEQITAESGLDYEVDVSPEAEAAVIDKERATAIFRIVQEGLNNVLRHANAHRVAVRAAIEDRTLLMLEIRDDGRGPLTTARADQNSWGLIGMNERARRFGGQVSIAAARAGGTRMLLRLPMED